MRHSIAPLPPLPWLETRPGLALAWPAPPRAPEGDLPRTPAGWRLRALAQAWAAHGAPDLLADPARAGLRELTLEGNEAWTGPALARLLAALAEGEDPPLIRIARDWSAGDPGLAALEGAAPPDGPIPFLHGRLHHVAALEGDWSEALGRLAHQGCPLSAEVWLLRGVNDRVELLRALLRRLLALRVRPYFLVDGEWLPLELRVPEAEALELMRGLRGWISGLAVPQYVREDRAGKRAPIVPDYLEAVEPEGVTVRNYAGRLHRYLNPRREGERGGSG